MWQGIAGGSPLPPVKAGWSTVRPEGVLCEVVLPHMVLPGTKVPQGVLPICAPAQALLQGLGGAGLSLLLQLGHEACLALSVGLAAQVLVGPPGGVRGGSGPPLV